MMEPEIIVADICIAGDNDRDADRTARQLYSGRMMEMEIVVPNICIAVDNGRDADRPAQHL